jgi:hypothetical protein
LSQSNSAFLSFRLHFLRVDWTKSRRSVGETVARLEGNIQGYDEGVAAYRSFTVSNPPVFKSHRLKLAWQSRSIPVHHPLQSC